MMTWLLWRLFYRTLPQHPLFWYQFDSFQTTTAVRSRSLLQKIGRLVLSLFIPVIVWLLFLPLFVFLPLFLFFAASLGGAMAAFSISRQVIREHEAGRYEQIAVTPSGDFGLSWTLAMRVLRRQPNLRQFLRLMRTIHGILFLTTFAIGMVNLIFLQDSRTAILESGLPILLIVIVFVALLEFDLVQAVLTGTLVGMLCPTISHRADSSLLAVALTLVLQLSLYLVVAVTLGLLTRILSVDADLLWNTEGILLILLTALASVLILHEVMLMGMWRILADRLNFNSRLLRTLERHGS